MHLIKMQRPSPVEAPTYSQKQKPRSKSTTELLRLLERLCQAQIKGNLALLELVQELIAAEQS